MTNPCKNKYLIVCRVGAVFIVYIYKGKGAVKVWTDAEWTERFANGDTAAFETIIEHYKAYVFAIVLRFVREPDDAQDIAQEVFLQIYRSLPEKRPENLKAWIGKVATNKAIDWKRRQERFQALEEYWQQSDLMGRTGNVVNLEDKIIERQQEAFLRQLCRDLPPPYRRVVVKHHFEGKSYQEIAREEGISLKTVESRLYRARNMMRERWKEGDG